MATAISSAAQPSRRTEIDHASGGCGCSAIQEQHHGLAAGLLKMAQNSSNSSGLVFKTLDMRASSSGCRRYTGIGRDHCGDARHAGRPVNDIVDVRHMRPSP
jgi:hypothetical protein